MRLRHRLARPEHSSGEQTSQGQTVQKKQEHDFVEAVYEGQKPWCGRRSTDDSVHVGHAKHDGSALSLLRTL